MTLPLRERRRQETARDIQKVALELATQHGLENVTTEEIANASGVSTRTFFNYYANKEAAAIGHPPGFSEDDLDTLRKGTASVSADLKLLLDRHIALMSEDEAILRMVGEVLRTNEKARGILEGFLAAERDQLVEALSDRVNNRHTAEVLTHNVTNSIGGAIVLWEHQENLSLRAALDVIWEGLIDASRLLLDSTHK